MPDAAAPPVINRRGGLAAPGHLFVAVLSVASSYARNVEYALEPGDNPDTMQWWIGDAGSFRIRTYAVDHDIHIQGLASGGRSIIELAVGHAERVYGDVVVRQVLIPIDDPTSDIAVASALIEAELPVRTEIAERFMFWLPDVDEPYRTKSQPVDARNT